MNDTVIFGNAYDDEDVGAEADLNNLDTTMNFSLIPTTRIDKDHPKDQIIRDLNSAIQIRRMTKISDEHVMVCYINKQRITNHKDYQNYLFACFLSQKDPKKVFKLGRSQAGYRQCKKRSFVNLYFKSLDCVNLLNGKKGHTQHTSHSQGPLEQKDREALPDIMFAVCACARDSPFDLEAFSDSDYAGASLYKKSTTGGCQFLGKRLISWQCKKQTIVANFTTEAKLSILSTCLEAEQDSGNINRTPITCTFHSQVPGNGSYSFKSFEQTSKIASTHKELNVCSYPRQKETISGQHEKGFPRCLYWGEHLLFASMLVQGPIQQGKGSIVPVESHHTPITTPSTSQPPLLSPSRVPTPPHDSPLPGGHTPGSDEGSMTLNELTVHCTQLSTKVASLEQDLKQTKKVYGNAYTKLIMRVKKLEHKGRRIAEIDQNPSISLVQDKVTSWIQEDVEIHGRTSADTEILLDQKDPTQLVKDLGSGEKGEKEISTANILVSTASSTPEVSTAAENLVYIRRKERQRIARDAEIAKQLQEEFDKARQEQEVVAEADQPYDIDWSDLAVLKYHAL
ncbi:hypothetical protein Tco_0451330 [Tanacetum coccineum]